MKYGYLRLFVEHDNFFVHTFFFRGKMTHSFYVRPEEYPLWWLMFPTQSPPYTKGGGGKKASSF